MKIFINVFLILLVSCQHDTLPEESLLVKPEPNHSLNALRDEYQFLVYVRYLRCEQDKGEELCSSLFKQNEEIIEQFLKKAADGKTVPLSEIQSKLK